MGQTLTAFSDKLKGKSSRDDRIHHIANKVFDRIKSDADKDSLSFDDLHIAVLYVYNDINKYLPGSHNDPPSKAQLRTFMQEFDMNLDGRLDREEFVVFIKKLTSNIVTSVGTKLIITLIAAPTVALLTKRATEGVPVVGKAVQKVPNSVYASLVTVAIVLVQNTVNK